MPGADLVITTISMVFAIDFYPCPMHEVATLSAALAALSAPIDSFAEWFISTAQFYAIVDQAAARTIGHCAIHESMGLTRFYVDPAERRHGQPLFRQVRKQFAVTQAMVPTCDEFFLSHALDEYAELHKQAYFFGVGAPNGVWDDLAGLYFQPATLADLAETAAINGDFLDQLEERISAGEIHIGRYEGVVVAMGIIERGQLLPDYGSIGMLVVPEQRQRGIGARMLRYLRHVCEMQQIHPIAGCGYDNLLSKRTLEAAGMVTATRLYG
ncbi:MAG: hypothetical protein KDE31_32165 [Caldilineaceae bacterium]|nr:hypothetical protein [Caldilineaceae bacterium]